MTSFNFTIKEHYTVNANRNESFYKVSTVPEKRQPHVLLTVAANDIEANFNFLLNRAIQTHELTAVTPLPESDFGKSNAAAMQRLGIAPADQWAANEELKALADNALRFERTEEDTIAEGLRGHLSDIQFMYELDTNGDDYDGADYDPDDDFHKWLIENEFAEIETDDDDPDYKTLSLFGDWRDRLSDYFGNYFLSVRIANTPEGDAPCVEADICVGGPTCYLRQFFGRGYVLVYSWGGLSDDWSLDSDLDDWLDSMLCTYTGEY